MRIFNCLRKELESVMEKRNTFTLVSSFLVFINWSPFIQVYWYKARDAHAVQFVKVITGNMGVPVTSLNTGIHIYFWVWKLFNRFCLIHVYIQIVLRNKPYWLNDFGQCLLNCTCIWKGYWPVGPTSYGTTCKTKIHLHFR